MKNNALLPELLTIKDVAALLNVRPRTVYDWAADGILIPVKLPGSNLRDKHGRTIARPHQRKMRKLLFTVESVHKFIEDCKAES